MTVEQGVAGSRLWKIVAVALAILSLGGCIGDAPESSSESSPYSYEEVVARLPLGGTPERPMFWTIEPFDDPEKVAAAQVIHHFESLLTLLGVTGLNGAFDREGRPLLNYFATEQFSSEVRSWFTKSSPSPGIDGYRIAGPRWFWVMAVELGPEVRTAEAVVCIDRTWYGYFPDGVPERRRPPGEPGVYVLSGYTLHKEQTQDGMRWKVHLEHSVYDHHAEQYSPPCQQWVGHSWPPETVSPTPAASVAVTAGRS